MLTKDLLRVSRAGGGYHPQFAGDGEEDLAARILGTYQGHVGEPRAKLQEALDTLEGEDGDFKLVRGFAKLVEREATFETQSPLPPERARRAAFEAAERAGGVVSVNDRDAALVDAADHLGDEPDAVERSLYADRDREQVLVSVDARWDAAGLVDQYDLSLAQTALFDATEVRIRSDDPKTVVSAVKRLRLMYEIRKVDGDREVVVTGPDALFRRTRRYGTRFARLLRTVAANAAEWRLVATIDDRGTEREMTLTNEDVTVPGVEPVTDVSFDSGVEADFAARFQALDLDWDLVREPEPLEAGANVVIPDFAFDYAHADFRVFFEIVGFWTPEYVAKKLDRLAELEDVELLVAVDEDLGVGEDIAASDHRAIPYSRSVRVKDVVDALGRYEEELVARSVADLPAELVPEADVTTVDDLAGRFGVSEDAILSTEFPEHERVGRTLVRPAVLDRIADEITDGISLDKAESVLAEYGVTDASAVLSRLGYRVAWNGLSGGTVREIE